MTDPRTIRESNIAREGLEGRVDLLQKWLWGVTGLLGTILAAAVAIYSQVGDVKTDIAVIKTSVTNISGRLERMEKGLDDIRNDGRTILGRLRPAEPAPRPPTRDPRDIIAGFWVTDAEAKLIRELLQAPQKTDAPPKIALWSRVPEATLIPDELVGKLPKLKGLRYAVDPGNNAIALIEPIGNGVIALI